MDRTREEKIAKKGLDNLLSDKTPNIDDVLLTQKDVKVVSSKTLIEEVQKRVYLALKQDFPYSEVTEESDEFLRSHIFSSIPMVVLYVDLVGSTKLVLELPQKQLASIISSFAQEMAYVIKQHNGYILKFVGDAVIGYFVKKDGMRIADSAVSCAESMIKVVKVGINPLLQQYDYPDLKIKIGMDYGENVTIRYGSDEKEAHVDLLGPSMNMAAKIQGRTQPDQILIGEQVYAKLHESVQKYFQKVEWEDDEWNYKSKTTGQVYPVYAYIGN